MSSTETLAVFFVCAVMVVAATIDGWKLKVPNWLTFPFIISGWIYHLAVGGLDALPDSLLGTAVGLGLLLMPYIIGGMGAGDVKLFAGVGAWMGFQFTLWAFFVSVIIGGIMAIGLVAYHSIRQRDWGVVWQNWERLRATSSELVLIRNPSRLAELAAGRKATALRLPYGIPLACGTIGYMFWLGLL